MEDGEDIIEERQLDVNEELRETEEKLKKAKAVKKKAQQKKKKAQQEWKKPRLVLKKKEARKKADDEVKEVDNEVKEVDNEVMEVDNEVKEVDNEVRTTDDVVKKARDKKSLGTSKVGAGHSYPTRSKASTTTQGSSSSRAFSFNSKSSSRISQVSDPSALPHFNIVNSDYLDHCPLKYYSLTEIARNYRLDIDDFQGRQRNEKIVCECLRRIDDNWEVECTATIDGFKNLSPMIAPTNFIPDVVIKCEDIVGFLGEVHSSPYEYSINKAIFGITNLFRLHRAKGIDIEKLRAFYFPRCEEKTCLVEIEVSFEDLQFRVELIAYPDMSNGLSRLCHVIQSQFDYLLKQYPSKSHQHSFSSHFLFRLTTNECNSICGTIGKQIKSSSHIILEADNAMYKLLYDVVEQLAIFRAEKSLKTCSRVIFPELVERSPIILYKYPKVKFSPLTPSKAKECLKSFIKEVKLTLDDLHQAGFSHNDLRLPNICFNDKYEAVLIDLDRVCSKSTCYSMFLRNERKPSCMYDLRHFKGNRTGNFTDFFQLGWLIAWILNPVGNEHERKLESQPDIVRKNKFIMELIERGTFNDDSLKNSFQEGKLLKTVLEKSI